mgnify:CR=1 FL=1
MTLVNMFQSAEKWPSQEGLHSVLLKSGFLLLLLLLLLYLQVWQHPGGVSSDRGRAAAQADREAGEMRQQ